jgi:hypothetical protein
MREGEDTMQQKRLVAGSTYEEPELIVLGTVQDLTRADKTYGYSDGNTLLGVPITNSSLTP